MARLTDIASELIRRATRMVYVMPQLAKRACSSAESKQSFHDYSKRPLENYRYFKDLRDDLESRGVIVEDITVDVHHFEQWLQMFPELLAHYQHYQDVFIQKCLEHYHSYQFLNLGSAETFIDVAAAGSPYAEVLSKRSNADYYCLDLCDPPGIHGNCIGADAGDTKLPDDYADAIALHCAYECLMGDADIRFTKEAARILKPGGSFLIAPLYLDATYFIATSPYCNQREIIVDQGALKVWRDDSYQVSFSRHYSPDGFYRRIFSQLPENLAGKVFFVKNLPDLMAHFKGQRIYCYFLFFAQKVKD